MFQIATTYSFSPVDHSKCRVTSGFFSCNSGICAGLQGNGAVRIRRREGGFCSTRRWAFWCGFILPEHWHLVGSCACLPVRRSSTEKKAPNISARPVGSGLWLVGGGVRLVPVWVLLLRSSCPPRHMPTANSLSPAQTSPITCRISGSSCINYSCPPITSRLRGKSYSMSLYSIPQHLGILRQSWQNWKRFFPALSPVREVVGCASDRIRSRRHRTALPDRRS